MQRQSSRGHRSLPYLYHEQNQLIASSALQYAARPSGEVVSVFPRGCLVRRSRTYTQHQWICVWFNHPYQVKKVYRTWLEPCSPNSRTVACTLLARKSKCHSKDDAYRLCRLDDLARLNRRYISFSNAWLKSMHWASPGGRHCGANNPQRPAARSIHCVQYQSSSRTKSSKLWSKSVDLASLPSSCSAILSS